MPQTICTWGNIVKEVKQIYPEIEIHSDKFKQLTASLAEKYGLVTEQSLFLASSLGIKFFPRPLGIPETWVSTLCKSFMSQKYTNPENPLEYAIVTQPDALGKLLSVIQRTPSGWADARWFFEIIPELNTIINNPKAPRPFSEAFNNIINSNKLNPWQVHALNLFFEKYVPGIEGICPTCYQIQLPRSGAGERWLNRSNGHEYEVRLSAAKTYGYPEQRREYVSQTIVNPTGEALFAMWDPLKCKVEYTDNMRQGFTHIPWEIYDYNKFSISMPLCKCKYQVK